MHSGAEETSADYLEEDTVDQRPLLGPGENDKEVPNTGCQGLGRTAHQLGVELNGEEGSERKTGFEPSTFRLKG